MSTVTVVQGPDDIETARLMALKGAVKLESLGMRRSVRPTARKLAAQALGMSPSCSHDTLIGALGREIDRRLKLRENNDEQAEHGQPPVDDGHWGDNE